MRRRDWLLGAASVVAAGCVGADFTLSEQDAAILGFSPVAADLRRAQALLRAHPTIDVHAHPGRTFVREAVDLPPSIAALAAGGAFEPRVLADMRAGFVSGGSFALVADFQVIDFANGWPAVGREFHAGEARASYERQVANLHAVLQQEGALIVREPADFRRALARRQVAALLTVEGADFLVGDLQNVNRAFADGVRSITLIHYRPNELGDNQTAPAVSGGLTPFGADVIREMDRLGMVVDLAHASESTVAAALNVCSRPTMLSHTHLQGHGATNARFISTELATEVCRRGGVIGAWPAGIGISSMAEFVDRIMDLANVLGPEHVSLGTDIDANFRPVFTNYRQMPYLVAELLRRGYGEANTIGFLGGNFLRVFEAVWNGRQAS
ncbi:MAG: membrane dipeptidase [Hyphomonadaceae bacterium]|nr:membrane dipeptidase [Hyphomonadaceae bacterium]